MSVRIKYETKEITVPSGTAPGILIEFRDYFDRSYAKATAMAIIKVAGTDNVEIGVRGNEDQVLDLVHSKLVEVNEQTPVMGRFMPVLMPAGGKEVKLQARPIGVATTAANVYQVVFKLEL